MASFALGALTLLVGVLIGYALGERVRPHVAEAAVGELPAPVSPHKRAVEQRRMSIPVK